MSPLCFFDTNVLVYAADADGLDKQATAGRLASGDGHGGYDRRRRPARRSEPDVLWDALIVRKAAAGGAEVLYSEDLSPGSIVDGVRILNPFV